MSFNFREEREKQGYSIQDVSDSLKIRKKYIVAIETEDYSDIPGEAYLTGYIRSYCDFLKIKVPKKELKNQVIVKPSMKDYEINKYFVAVVSLILLLLVTVLYYKYIDDVEINMQHATHNLIYDDESNNSAV